MNAAKIDTSDRLKRVDRLLSSGRAMSTIEIMHAANVCAVNSVVSELRANGRQIRCWQKDRIFYYQMVSPAA